MVDLQKARDEAKEVFTRREGSIIEPTINYTPGRLQCSSNKYDFDITPSYILVTARKTEHHEFRYMNNMLIKDSSDPELVISLKIINDFHKKECNSLTDLTEIIKNSIRALETGESTDFI